MRQCHQNFLRPTAIAKALSMLFVLVAAASNAQAATPAKSIDPLAETLKRLQASPAGRTADGFTLSSIQLMNELATSGITFTLPSVVPEIPKVLMQGRIANCNDREIQGNANVGEDTTNSESFTKATTLSSTTTLSAGYSSPIGISASLSEAVQISGTNTTQNTHTKTTRWNAGGIVPVGAKQAVTWQFVVASREMNNIPWSTNAIVSGPVTLNYVKPAAAINVCLYEDNLYTGRKKCFVTTAPFQVSQFNFPWDNGQGNVNDAVSSVSISGNGKVTFYENNNFDGFAVTYSNSVSIVGNAYNDKFSSMKIEPAAPTKTVVSDLSALLSDSQRRIAISGTYDGVNGVMGDFRAGAPVALTPSDCNLAPPSGIQAGATTGQARSANGYLLGIAPLQGKILQSGIMPASKPSKNKPS
jgi:hypothetical protein